ncbi:MAG: sulfur oxidation c-type cytochrome SoxX [Curvibacter sp.]
MKPLLAAIVLTLPLAGGAVTVVGDGIPAALEGRAGDAARGRAIAASRSQGLCLLCHSGPIPEERFQGNLAPDLARAGARWSAAQLRLRLVAPQHLNPDSIMPAYYRSTGLTRVGHSWQDRPLLDAQQIEDVLAWLLTLKD